ncbi:hypothetical protein BRC79_08425 [Halobacteriales archaeon QH_8_67_27]|nr:MAG: hypothetical protein BRC79_08425 [Halobacteriales archaeon QH_8_67_27]
MSTHNSTVRSVAPSYPDAEPVGSHLVIDKTEWVPGRHPESHRGHVKCDAERLTRRELPQECPA